MNWESKWELFKKNIWPKILRNTLAILCLLLIVILLFRECTRPGPCESETVIDTLIIPGDTIPSYIPYPKPKPDTFWKDSIKFITLYEHVDSAKIIELFMTTRVYNRVWKDDTSAYIKTSDTVWGNELWPGEMTFINRRPQAIYTIGDKLRNRYYIGLQVNGVTGSAISPLSFGPRLSVVLKGAFAFGGSYDPFNKIGTVNLDWKLSFKKKKKK